jgi:hypothetical protein
MDCACFDPDHCDCVGYADTKLEGVRRKSQIISAGLNGLACNQKISLSALMNPADAWSKSRTSSAVLCVAIRNKHRGILALAGIPNVSALRKQSKATSWKSQRKCLDKCADPEGVLQEVVY